MESIIDMAQLWQIVRVICLKYVRFGPFFLFSIFKKIIRIWINDPLHVNDSYH